MAQKKWTEEDINILKEMYPIASPGEIATVLGRTPGAVKTKAFKLGITGVSSLIKAVTHEQFVLRVSTIAPELTVLGRYVNSKTPVEVSRALCGHTWNVTPNAFMAASGSSGKRCPICAEVRQTQSFLDALPVGVSLVGEYINRKTPVNVQSSACGHTWSLTPDNYLQRGSGKDCPTCRPQHKTTAEFELEVQGKSKDLHLIEEYTDGKTYITIMNSKCLHSWEVIPRSFLQHNCGVECPRCTPKGTSKAETTLGDFLEKYTEVVRGSRSLLGGKEIDIYLPEFKLGVEYNGLHWHSEEFVPERYHIEKTELAAIKGIRLIHVFEHEDMDIVKSRLLSKIGKSDYKIGARETEVKEISFPRDFLDINHIQGAGRPTKTNLGLYYKDYLVAVMTFAKPTKNTDYDQELVRYCSLLDITVVGGAGKLLKYYENNYAPESILSYSDKRWSTGGLYKALEFSYLGATSNPNYFYHKGAAVLSRQKAQKSRLKELVPDFFDEALTENQIMNNAGWSRVYDCGSDIWGRHPKVA